MMPGQTGIGVKNGMKFHHQNGNGNGTHTEQALRASELSYRRLFEAARDGILILDVDTGRINDVNPFLVELLGFSRSELVGKTVGELSPFKDIVANQAMLKRLQEDAYVRYHDLPLETKDGRKMAVEFVSNVYQAGDKKVIQCNIRDITEHKRVEEALGASRQMLGEIINALPARVFWKDKNLIYLGCNTVFARDAGFAGPKDIIGKDDFQMGWRDQAEKYRGDDREVIESGCAKLLIEESQTTPEGNTITLLSSKIPLRDSKGEIVGMLGTYLDITKRKWAEEELRLKTALLEAQVDSALDGILVVDGQGKKILQNERLNELWKLPPHIAASQEDAVQVQFAASRAKNPGEFAGRVAHLYSHPDEVSRDEIDLMDGTVLDRYSSPVRDKAGKYFGRIWTFRDITERKRQERELIEKNTELERFTYTVSHDLKSPLVTIKTFLSYLEQDMAGPDKERVKQDVTFMHTAADKMGWLLDELLNLVRVGRKMNPVERVTFKELAQEAVELVAGRISTSGAVVQVAGAAVVLEGDRPRLVEIWQNLVENACKFMGDQPRPRVEIGVEQRGAETVFFVRDNGMGIDPHYQEKVFGLFEKLDPMGEGVGMGLALVRRVVELYQGRIWVESGGPGQGANFLFTLPAAVAAGILPAVSGLDSRPSWHGVNTP
jgi:PAS domain S-box-containing protein